VALELPIVEYIGLYSEAAAMLYRRELKARREEDEIIQAFWQEMADAIEASGSEDVEEIVRRARERLRRRVEASSEYRELSAREPEKAGRLLASLLDYLEQIIRYLVKVSREESKEEAYRKAESIRDELARRYSEKCREVC